MNFPSSIFHYSGHLNMMAAKLSALQHVARGESVFEPVNDRTADEGITILSKDDCAADFFVSFIDKDREGKVFGWVLKPTVETVVRLPALAKCKVLIINNM